MAHTGIDGLIRVGTNATNFLSDGEFESGIADWTDGAGLGSISHDSINENMDLNSSAGDAEAQVSGATVASGNYVMTVNVVTTGDLTINIGTTAGGSEISTHTVSQGDNTIKFTATGTTTHVEILNVAANADTRTVDSVTISRAEQLGQLRSWSIEEAQDALETTVMGGGSVRTFTRGLKAFTGSMDVFFDETDDTGQDLMTKGSFIELTLYPEGEDTGDTILHGQVMVTGVTSSASVDGLIEKSITVQGNNLLYIDSTKRA